MRALWVASATALNAGRSHATDVVVFRHAGANVNPKAPQPTGDPPTCIRNPTVARLGIGISDKPATLLAVCGRPPATGHLRPPPHTHTPTTGLAASTCRTFLSRGFPTHPTVLLDRWPSAGTGQATDASPRTCQWASAARGPSPRAAARACRRTGTNPELLRIYPCAAVVRQGILSCSSYKGWGGSNGSGASWGPLKHNVTGMGAIALQVVFLPPLVSRGAVCLAAPVPKSRDHSSLNVRRTAQNKVMLAFNRHNLRHIDDQHILWCRLGSLSAEVSPVARTVHMACRVLRGWGGSRL